MSNLPRRLILPLATTGCLMLTGLLALLGINAFDEPLDPGTEAWLAPPPKTVAAEQNGYFIELGLAVQTDQPLQVGRAIAADINRLPLPVDIFQNQFDTLARRHGKLWQLADLPKCRDKTADCVNEIYRQADTYRKLIEREKQPLTNYYTMIAMPAYENAGAPKVVRSDMPAVPLAQLARADMALTIREGQADKLQAVVSKMAQDQQYWIRALSHSRLLSDAMVARLQVAASQRFIREIQAHHPAIKPLLAPQLTPSLQQFASHNSQRIMRAIWQGELRFTWYQFQSVYDQPEYVEDASMNKLADWFFLPNATLNQFRRTAEQIVESGRHMDECESGIRWFYNPDGREYNCVGSADKANYSRNIVAAQKQAAEFARWLDTVS